jgi:hypothetical protein
MPFTYVSSLLNPKALDICPKLNALRGTGEDVGYIFKGFAAEMGGGGPQLIRDEEALKKLTAEHPADPGNEEGWRQNLSYGLQVLRGMAESPAKRKAVTMLMENGMWETRPWYPVCLTAEAMWDPHRKPEDLKLQLDQCRQVVSVAAGR